MSARAMSVTTLRVPVRIGKAVSTELTVMCSRPARWRPQVPEAANPVATRHLGKRWIISWPYSGARNR